MFYTGKGDKGQTTLFGSAKKIPKNSPVMEALGELDELNSLLGVCKVKIGNKKEFFNFLEEIQNDLFVIQAEVSGAKKKLDKFRIIELERVINDAEKKLPKIKSFTVSGGTELSALFDLARTVARRVERRIVSLNKKQKINSETLKYLNRLSSLLFALARLSNKNRGIKENKPKY